MSKTTNDEILLQLSRLVRDLCRRMDEIEKWIEEDMAECFDQECGEQPECEAPEFEDIRIHGADLGTEH